MLILVTNLMCLHLMLKSLDLTVEIAQDGFDWCSGSQGSSIGETYILVRRNQSGWSQLLQALTTSATVSDAALAFHSRSFLLKSFSLLSWMSDPHVRLLAVEVLLL